MSADHKTSFAPHEYVRRWLSDIKDEQQGLQNKHHPDEAYQKRGQARGIRPKTAANEGLVGPENHEHPRNEPNRCHRRKTDGTNAQNDLQHHGNNEKRPIHEYKSKTSALQASAIVNDDSKEAKESERREERAYGRRSRHKTRLDKYELKAENLGRRKMEAEQVRPRPKHRKRRKTGNRLNEQFKAPNMAGERLTLKPHTGPGIFGKGKASDVVERRGLPDLTFSEMKFLTKPRTIDENRQIWTCSESAEASKKSTNDSTKETSDLFFRARIEAHHEHELLDAGCTQLPPSADSGARSSPARMDSGKVLSGVSGHHIFSGRLHEYNRDSGAAPDAWRADSRISQLQHFGQRKKAASVSRRPSDAQSSDHSWSFSAPRVHTAQPPRIHQPDIELRISPGKQDQPCQDQIEPRQVPVPSHDVHRMPDPIDSSISDSLQDHYTKHALLGEPKQVILDCLPTIPAAKGRYSLGELKRLAKLSELDAADRTFAVDESRLYADSGFKIATHDGSVHRKHQEEVEYRTRPMTRQVNDQVAQRFSPNTVGLHRPSIISQRSASPSWARTGTRQDVPAAPNHVPELLNGVQLTPRRISWLLEGRPIPSQFPRATVPGAAGFEDTRDVNTIASRRRPADRLRNQQQNREMSLPQMSQLTGYTHPRPQDEMAVASSGVDFKQDPHGERPLTTTEMTNCRAFTAEGLDQIDELAIQGLPLDGLYDEPILPDPTAWPDNEDFLDLPTTSAAPALTGRQASRPDENADLPQVRQRYPDCHADDAPRQSVFTLEPAHDVRRRAAGLEVEPEFEPEPFEGFARRYILY